MKRKADLEKNLTVAEVVGKEKISEVDENGFIDANITYTILVEKKIEEYYFEERVLRIPDKFLFSTKKYVIADSIVANIEE